MLPTKFQFIWQSGFREGRRVFRNQPIRNKNVTAMFVNGSELNEQSL
jgi:hypothetical protein